MHNYADDIFACLYVYKADINHCKYILILIDSLIVCDFLFQIQYLESHVSQLTEKQNLSEDKNMKLKEENSALYEKWVMLNIYEPPLL